MSFRRPASNVTFCEIWSDIIGRAAAPVALFGLAVAALAQAQLPAGPVDERQSHEVPIQLDRLDVLHVTPHGQADGPGGAQRGCSELATFTDANFSGGSFILQAGFAEHEWLAARYTLPAGAFPIKVEMIEAIFATSNASESTVTQWSVGAWAGPPNTGTQVHLSSSDDLILPHIHLPPGTNGVDVQFSIDPGDPNQIIVNDDGTHSFSVGFRIDHHNQQTQNPCFTAPPTCCNAFPTTDVSGLSSPAGNWLYGVN